jgi:ParB family transcriptional regulator, chromosome partitioning protein
MSAPAAAEVKEIPLGLIDEPELPSRTEMDEHKMDELTASVLQLGILQNLIVFRKGERFEVIAGHRRWHAAKRAGLAAVPCRIYPSREAARNIAIQFAENAKREKVNDADEAQWFSELLELHCGGDVDQLCALMGEKRPYVEDRLLLMQGDPLVLQRLREKQIQFGVAKQLNRCTDETYRRYLLHQAIVGGATVAVVSGWLSDWKREADRQAGVAPPPSTAPVPAPMPQSDYFRCYVCRGTENVAHMRPLNVHDYCILSILDKLLAAYHGDEQHAAQQTDPRRI